MAPSCWFFWALCLPLMLAVVVVAEEQIEGCSRSAKRGGNVTVSDPFWLRDSVAEQACGSSDIEVSCFNDTPVLQSSMGVGFTVMDMSYEERSLRVADGGKLFLLHPSNSCDVPIWNTSAKLSHPFSISPGNLNLIMYNCTENGGASALALRGRELVPTRMGCGNSPINGARLPLDMGAPPSNHVLNGSIHFLARAKTAVPLLGFPLSDLSYQSRHSVVEDKAFIVLPKISSVLLFISRDFGRNLLFRMFPWPGPCLLLLAVAVAVSAIIPAPMLAAAASEPERCGSVTVSRPFGVVHGSEENRCAQMGFQVHCKDHVPYLGYYEPDYGLRILHIFVHNGSLLVSDAHKLQDFDGRSSPQGCHVPTADTATKVGDPFSISPLNQNLVFYNCTRAPGRPVGLLDTVCRNNTFVRAGGPYNASGGIDGGYALEGCNATAVPVLGASGDVNASDYEKLIRDGFLLTWQPPSAGNGEFSR
ncbi:unnamed protein product [Triticum turgidum subsp. durum]|uniref:Wall-associated receptor kinase galacturonan-binding domain-containing protein n=3 Tax=Triticum TaxID=4564 RepID=A0A9R1Q6N0_TRITD|nr:unnamed protein product [Triticum turgidum subsp. durum]